MNANTKFRELNDCAGIEGAADIIAGFLERFEAPTCIEQQQVVSQANAWLLAYEDGDFLTFAGKAISQNNNNTHTD